MPDRIPGHTCQETKPVSIKDGGSALAPTPTCGPTGGSVWRSSNRVFGIFEPREELAPEFGACYQPVETRLCLTPVEKQMLAALRLQRANIIAAEQRFRVDRRAIAGAIAWEMMEDPMTRFREHDPLPARGMGWGQIHRYSLRLSSLLGASTIAQEVEDAGYLPKQSDSERKRICSSPEGSIIYIGGIMAAIAEVPESMGFEEDIRSNPAILTNVYHGKTLKSWRADLAKKLSTKGRSATFEAGTDMAIWVGRNLTFLEEAVGSPDLPESAPGYTSPLPDQSIIVGRGSALSDIAQAQYGSADLWPLIYDSNRATIGANPNLIQPGTKLTLPPLSRYTDQEIADAKRRAPSWKNYK